MPELPADASSVFSYHSCNLKAIAGISDFQILRQCSPCAWQFARQQADP
jgi:hypothetical protein